MNERLKECGKCGHEYEDFFIVRKQEGYECVDCAYGDSIVGERVMLLEDI